MLMSGLLECLSSRIPVMTKDSKKSISVTSKEMRDPCFIPCRFDVWRARWLELLSACMVVELGALC